MIYHDKYLCNYDGDDDDDYKVLPALLQQWDLFIKAYDLCEKRT